MEAYSYQKIVNHLGKNYNVFEQIIGRGEFGTIYRAVKYDTKETVAIKQIDLTCFEKDQNQINYIKNEIEVMKRCQNHPNIIRLIDSFQIEQFLYTVMENCAMDLNILWQKLDNQIPEPLVIHILRDISNGFEYLHQNNIIHRDIKLENILMTAPEQFIPQIKSGNFEIINESSFKIADFGLSKILEQENELCETYVGTRLNMAPELLQYGGPQLYGIKVDMYSLGVIVYQMLYGSVPYMAKGFDSQEELIQRENAPFKSKNPQIQISQTIQNLVKQMIKYDVYERLDWSQLQENNIFKRNLAFPIINNIVDIELKENQENSYYPTSELSEIQKTFGLNYENEVMFEEGNFGKIYRAKTRQSGEIVVIKQINIQNMDETTVPYMFNEIEIMRKCKNKNLIRLIESVSTDKYIYIVMENCQTNLDKMWQELFKKTIPEKYVVYILKQIVHGFAYLHSNKIIHRDIKLENILVSCTEDNLKEIYTGQYDALYKMTFKIADFGLSKSLDNQNQLTDTYAGSPLTMAPEILEDKPYGIKADMFSLGVILYQMLYGNYPYQSNQNDMSDMQHERIKRGDAPFQFNNLSISKDLESLIKSMLQYDATKRLDWDELYQSKFIKIDFNKQIHLIDLEIKIEQPLQFADLEEAKIQIKEEEKEKQIDRIAIQQIYSSDNDFDPMAEFLGRIVRLKNQYSMLFRASQSLKVLLSKGPQLPQNLNLNKMAKSLESLSVRVYQKIRNQLLEKRNILNLNENYWKLLQKSQQYQVVKQIILEDSKLFQVSQQGESIMTLNDPFSKNDNYQKDLFIFEKILVKLAENQTEENILLKIKLSLIHIMYIYFAFDEKYEYPIEQDVEFKLEHLKQVDEKIKILRDEKIKILIGRIQIK